MYKDAASAIRHAQDAIDGAFGANSVNITREGITCLLGALGHQQYRLVVGGSRLDRLERGVTVGTSGRTMPGKTTVLRTGNTGSSRIVSMLSVTPRYAHAVTVVSAIRASRTRRAGRGRFSMDASWKYCRCVGRCATSILFEFSLALACSFAVYFSSQSKAINWPDCLAASGYICRAPTAIMTDEICAMAHSSPYLVTSVGILGRGQMAASGRQD